MKNSADEMSENYLIRMSATPDLLKQLYLWANVSGKSNLLKALASMNKIMKILLIKNWTNLLI